MDTPDAYLLAAIFGTIPGLVIHTVALASRVQRLENRIEELEAPTLDNTSSPFTRPPVCEGVPCNCCKGG